jgi:hypothetical protein
MATVQTERAIQRAPGNSPHPEQSPPHHTKTSCFHSRQAPLGHSDLTLGSFPVFQPCGDSQDCRPQCLQLYPLLVVEGEIWLNSTALRDIHLLMETLLVPDEDPICSRSIALLVPRTATHWLKSDASYAGIGGWSQDFSTFMWHVTREDLTAFGFHMKTIGMSTDKPMDSAARGLHIKPLEFLAVIINLWLALKIIRDDPLCLRGSIIDLLSDNTTALS